MERYLRVSLLGPVPSLMWTLFTGPQRHTEKPAHCAYDAQHECNYIARVELTLRYEKNLIRNSRKLRKKLWSFEDITLSMLKHYK